MKTKFFLLLFLLLITVSVYSQNGWYWLNPLPTGNTIYSLKFINSQTGFGACGSGTIIKTTNGGLNWAVSMLNLSVELYAVHFINSNTGMTGGRWGYLFRTTNSGTNWTRIDIGETTEISDIRFRNSSSGILITNYNDGASGENKIYKTTNGGLNWELKFTAGTGSACWWLGSIAYASNNIVYVAGDKKLLKSSDAGNTWDTVTGCGFQQQQNRTVMFVNSLTGFVLSSSYGSNSAYIQKTTDGGLSWIKNPIYTNIIRDLWSIAFINGNTGIAAGRYTAAYRTTNGGVNWMQISSPQDTMRLYNFTASAGFNRLFYGGEGGMIYRSTNSGANYTRLSKSFTDETINSVSFINSQTGIAAANKGGIFKTTNGGMNWVQQICPNAGNIIKVKLFNGNDGYASAHNGYIYKTINGGSTWSTIYSDTLAASWKTADFPDINTIYVSGGNCIHSGVKSADGGATWSTLYFECNCSGHPPPTGCKTESIVIMANKNIYSVFGFESAPHAESYSFADMHYDGSSHRLFFGQGGSNDRLDYADYFDSNFAIAVGARGRYIITNNGFRSFTEYMYPVTIQSAMYYLSIAGAQNVLANIYNPELGKSGIYKSSNGGINWGLSGIVSSNFTGIRYYNTGYAVTFGRYGCMAANINPAFVNLSEIHNSLPSGFRLFQNYPNPFNPSTKIRYEIPEAGNVQLYVYDLLGREIVKLINGIMKPGIYEIEWDGTKFSNGVYFYRIISGDYSETKKMVLVK